MGGIWFLGIKGQGSGARNQRSRTRDWKLAMSEINVNEPFDCPFRDIDSTCYILGEIYDQSFACDDGGEFPKECPLLQESFLVKKV